MKKLNFIYTSTTRILEYFMSKNNDLPVLIYICLEALKDLFFFIKSNEIN